MRHLALLAVAAVALAPRPCLAELGGGGVEPPAFGRATQPDPDPEPGPARQLRYTEEQRRLVRAATAAYSVGVAAGVLGAPAFVMATYGFGEHPGVAVSAAAAGWTTEPTLMLVADLLVGRALGRRPSRANIAAWVLLASTAAFGLIGGSLMASGGSLMMSGSSQADYEGLAWGFTIAGAILFLPMQIFTDVLGTRALSRASRILHGRDQPTEPAAGGPPRWTYQQQLQLR